MRFFDTDVNKASKNIIKTLNLQESAASVKAQINKDKPEEAPKETKDSLVKKVQSAKIPTKQALKEDLDEIQNQIAELQDYLDNTPEIGEDERAAIQAEIDELIDEVNYQDAGLDMEIEEPSEDDLHMGESEKMNEGYSYDQLEDYVSLFASDGISADEAYDRVVEETGDEELAGDVASALEKMNESSLEEAPNPENAEINRKILNTIRTKNEDEPRYRKDLEDAGLTVQQDKYGTNWEVVGTNGESLYKGHFMGGKNARFNANNNKVADYYNLLTKKNDNNWRNRSSRWSKPVQVKDKDYVKNPETGEYEWKTTTKYRDKSYDNRQRQSMGYDYNNLKGGSENIRNYKDADDTAKRNGPGSWSNNYDNERVERAQRAYDEFQANISKRLAELKASIDSASKDRDRNLKIASDAEEKKKQIIADARARRNKNLGGNE